MSVRQSAMEILNAVFSESVKAGEALEHGSKGVSDQDRRLLHEMVYGVLRRFYSLEADYSRFCRSKPDPYAQIALLLGTYQLRYMRIPVHAAVSETVAAVDSLQPKAKGFVNAVLRRAAENSAPTRLKPHQRAELPKWIYADWREAFGGDVVQQFSEALCDAPKLSLALFEDRCGWIEKVRGMGIAAEPGELASTAVLLPSGTDVTKLPGFEAGAFTVMDQAAQAAVVALAPSRRNGVILDICAAPGGKTAMLAHCFPEATIVAIELNPRRIPRLRENLARLKCSNVKVIRADGLRLPFRDGLADAIMLDAPCSASGVLRRHPDAKFLHDSSDVDKLAAVQQQLLHESLRVLNDGGEMIYAVCSIHPRENEQVIEACGGKSKEQRLLPSSFHDGFYFARLGGYNKLDQGVSPDE